jgi:hypothetical protein
VHRLKGQVGWRAAIGHGTHVMPAPSDQHLTKHCICLRRLPSALQGAGRRVAFYTFAHVLGLDLQFHLDRKTGRCSTGRMLGIGSCGGIARFCEYGWLEAAPRCPRPYCRLVRGGCCSTTVVQARCLACWSGGPAASP